MRCFVDFVCGFTTRYSLFIDFLFVMCAVGLPPRDAHPAARTITTHKSKKKKKDVIQ